MKRSVQFPGDAVRNDDGLDGAADVFAEGRPGKGNGGEAPPSCGFGAPGGVAERLDGSGVGERYHDGVDGVVTVVFAALFRSAAQYGVEFPFAAQVGGCLPAGGEHAAPAGGVHAGLVFAAAEEQAPEEDFLFQGSPYDPSVD